MENLDVFESIFKRATRQPYQFKILRINKILLVTDLPADELNAYETEVKQFIGTVTDHESHQWVSLGKDDYQTWNELSACLKQHQPDLIICYRLMHESHDQNKFSLGAFVDTVTQQTDCPIMLLPDPQLEKSHATLRATNSVMVVTDHLNGDHRLVNYGVHFTKTQGQLTLVHLEDKDTYDYYMEAISMIPEISTTTAQLTIKAQLLAQPNHYIDSVESILKAKQDDINLEKIVGIGHIIDSYRDLLKNNDVNLLIFNTKDDTQLAMHSLGYSLAVEFKHIPMLLI